MADNSVRGSLREELPVADLERGTGTGDRVLKPGGWVQMTEIYFNIQSDSGMLNERSALRMWSSHFMDSLDDFKDARIATKLNNLLTEAGLADVDTTMIPLPLSGWPRGAIMTAKLRES